MMITPSSPRPSHQCYCYLGCAVLVLRSWRWASSFGEVRVGSVGSPPSIAFSDIFRHQTQSSKSLRLFLVCPSPAREAQKLRSASSSCFMFVSADDIPPLSCTAVPLAGYHRPKQSLLELLSSVFQSVIATYLSFSRNITLNTTCKPHHDERSHPPSRERSGHPQGVACPRSGCPQIVHCLSPGACERSRT